MADEAQMTLCSDELYSLVRLGAPRGQMDIGDLDWNTPPARPVCGQDEIHIWRASLRQEAAAIQALGYLLTADECIRARRFRFERERAHFIIARGLLRLILGRYLSVEPHTVQLTYNEYGKPALPHDWDSMLCFNLAHSRDVVLYAFTDERCIGIDVEYISVDIAVERVAQLFFSADEVDALRALPVALQREAFLRCWTRKEAYSKAQGLGLSLASNSFSLPVRPDDPPAPLSTGNPDPEKDVWSLYDFQLADGNDGYVGAVATRRGACSNMPWRAR